VVMTFLNSELRHDSTPDYEYALKVPTGYGDKVLAALPGLPSYTPPEAVYGWHTVRSGDTFGSIARRYRTSISAIQRFNKGINPRYLRIGQRIKIPGKSGVPDEEPVSSSNKSPAKSGDKTKEQISYTVKDGDTLFTLAKQFKTSIEKIKADNNLDSDALSVGQKLVIDSKN
jgi:membrane-bound lytic murein transglycosylase D